MSGDEKAPGDEVHLTAKCISYEMFRLIPCSDCGIEVQSPLSAYRLTTQCDSCVEQSRLADERMTRTIVVTAGMVLGLMVLLAILAL